MDKTFSPSYSSSQITYVEAEAVDFSRFCFRFRFHRKRIASTASASGFRFHIPGSNTDNGYIVINGTKRRKENYGNKQVQQRQLAVKNL